MSLAFRPFSARRAACLALLVAAAVPSGSAAAASFFRDPVANGWRKVGNSNTQAAGSFGGWAKGSSTANFDVYSGKFVLSASDTVSAPTLGTATGDCFLSSGGALAGGCVAALTNAGTGWLAGDFIVGLGVRWVGGQQGQSSTQFTMSFDPLGTSGWVAGTAFSNEGSSSFSGASSDGSFSFNVLPAQLQVQNRNPYTIYRINPPGSVASSQPYGNVVSDNPPNNVSTSALTSGVGSPKGTLPVRVFGNLNPTGWDYYTAFMNQSLMQRNGFGEAMFGSNAKWVVAATQLNGLEVAATGPMNLRSGPAPVPGPLPLLGAGAAFGLSRRLRQRARRRPSRS